MRRWARVWWLVDLIQLNNKISFLFLFKWTRKRDGPNMREPDLHYSRGLSCGGGKCRGSTREGGRGSRPNSGRFYPYPLQFWPQVISSFSAPSYFEFEAERPLFKSHMPSGALTVDDKVSLFCFVSFCSTARIISGASTARKIGFTHIYPWANMMQTRCKCVANMVNAVFSSLLHRTCKCVSVFAHE